MTCRKAANRTARSISSTSSPRALPRLGFQMSDVWYTVWGQSPQITSGGEIDDVRPSARHLSLTGLGTAGRGNGRIDEQLPGTARSVATIRRHTDADRTLNATPHDARPTPPSSSRADRTTGKTDRPRRASGECRPCRRPASAPIRHVRHRLRYRGVRQASAPRLWRVSPI